jgi:hypothetical protein
MTLLKKQLDGFLTFEPKVNKKIIFIETFSKFPKVVMARTNNSVQI